MHDDWIQRYFSRFFSGERISIAVDSSTGHVLVTVGWDLKMRVELAEGFMDRFTSFEAFAEFMDSRHDKLQSMMLLHRGRGTIAVKDTECEIIHCFLD